MTRIFISHSHSDEAIADSLINFLQEALNNKQSANINDCLLFSAIARPPVGADAIAN